MTGIMKCVGRCISIIIIIDLLFHPGYVLAVEAEPQKVVAVSSNEEDQANFNLLPKPKASPAGPTGYQKVVNIVEGSKKSRPGVYWTQKDNGDWMARTFRELVEVRNRGSRSDPAPAASSVRDKIIMSRPEYKPEKYKDQYRNDVLPSIVANAHISKVVSTESQGEESLIGVDF